MSWVSVDGPYNEHLLRDTGQGTLAVGAVLLFALWTRSRTAARAAAPAVAVPTVPHTLYHLVHVDKLATAADQIAQTTVVLLTAAKALLLLAAAFRRRGRPASAVELAKPAVVEGAVHGSGEHVEAARA